MKCRPMVKQDTELDGSLTFQAPYASERIMLFLSVPPLPTYTQAQNFALKNLFFSWKASGYYLFGCCHNISAWSDKSFKYFHSGPVLYKQHIITKQSINLVRLTIWKRRSTKDFSPNFLIFLILHWYRPSKIKQVIENNCNNNI